MKPPITRTGRTHKIKIGPVTAHITVNRNELGHILEVFGKANQNLQGHVDMACRLISLGLQHRADVPTIIRHLRGDRTPPNGIAGQPTSIYSAIAEILERESPSENS